MVNVLIWNTAVNQKYSGRCFILEHSGQCSNLEHSGQTGVQWLVYFLEHSGQSGARA